MGGQGMLVGGQGTSAGGRHAWGRMGPCLWGTVGQCELEGAPKGPQKHGWHGMWMDKGGTMAIDWLYLVAPQLLNQHVELR